MHDAAGRATARPTERARIAREVHDVVAHSLTVVMLNLTGARRALATDPARADEALARAEIVGRESLDSIRQVMGLLREPGVRAAPLPQPGAGRRAARSSTATAAPGWTVDADDRRDVAGRSTRPSSSSCTASCRSRWPTCCSTRPARRPRSRCALDDATGRLRGDRRNGRRAAPAPASRADRAGLGTRGMAERVRAVGGELHAGPTADGGWQVVRASGRTARRPRSPATVTTRRHG